jgi:hypothetical protein
MSPGASVEQKRNASLLQMELQQLTSFNEQAAIEEMYDLEV